MSFPYWARALGLAGKHFRSARAQNLKLVLEVVLVLQYEGRYHGKSYEPKLTTSILRVFTVAQET